jgi:ubiquinone/menaquinone biosynthesis C-methylase UbiE
MSMFLPAYQKQRNFFDRQAARWHFPDADRQKITKILESLALPENGIILDAGCGTGNLFPILRTVVPHATVVACDMAWQMLTECRRRAPDLPALLWRGFCEQLPLKNESLNLILNYCVFPHIRNKNAAVSEFWRVLKPGGQYLIIHPHGRSSTNLKHCQIGKPVADDILPSTFSIVNYLSDKFFIRQIIDCDDLFLIEAVKIK